MADDRADEKSVEQTAVTVKAASSSVESTTIETQAKIVGRTMWDSAVEIAKMLGPYAPWVIMLSGLVFAFYKFSQLKETAQSKAREQVQKELDSAHHELRSTYEQIGKMTTQQLENVSSMLRLHGETANSTEAQRKRYNELHEQAIREKEEADKARAEGDRSKADAALAKKDGQDAAKAAAEARAQAEAANKDMLAKKAELDRKSEEINQRADKIGDLNQKLIELATRVSTTSVSQDIRDLVNGILKDYSPEPQKLLTRFAANPSADTTSALQNLIGVGAKTIEPSLKEGSGFAFWQMITDSGEADDKSFAYAGVVRQTATSDEYVVTVSVEHEKVVDIRGFSKLLAVKAPSSNDWNKIIGYVLYESLSDKPSGADSFLPEGETWTLGSFRTAASRSPVKVLSGFERPLPWTSVADLKEKHPKLFKAATAGDGTELGESISMLDRAQTFQAATLKDVFPKTAPADLRDIFVMLLSAAIEHKTSAAGIMVAPRLGRDAFGKIAAAALKPSFRPIAVTAGNERIDSQLPQDASPELYKVLCEYLDPDKRPKRVRFTFGREATGSVWTLVNFEEFVPIPGTSDF
jgi:hypothetical protein